MGQLFLISALIAYISCVQGQSPCTTGQCMSIYDCQPLLTLLNKPDRTAEDVDTLRKSACGFQGSTPQVCCPSNQCYTPEWQLGTCIGIYSCPHLAKRLTPPVTKESLDYVQKSRCEGSDQYSVCCGPSEDPPPVTPTKNCVLTAAPPNPGSRCCGIESSSDRIIGGIATEVDQYPWLTVVEYRKDGRIRLLCGGALISGKYVLTAGHCVVGAVLRYGTPVSVRLGEYDTSHEGADCAEANGGGQDCTQGTVSIPIERSIPHPEYNPDSSLRRNDIALLRLKQIAPYTEFIRPICLPNADETLNPPNNLMLFAAGWGAVNETTSSSNVKQHVALPFKSLESCQPAYSSKRNVALWAGQLCAGGVGGKDSCKGDSGGPLMYYKDRKTWEVMGIVSFGPTPCGIEDIPGVYTKVYHYMPWIHSQIKP